MLGRFYLGKKYDLESGSIKPDYINYDAKDLTTHAVCVGMTGSGKTGLCISLLEEAGLDGVPAIAVDPKGDLSNLLLTFPELSAEDFRPWVDEAEAVRKGQTVDQYAAQVAQRWRQGLQQWGQDGSRIARLRETVDMAIYTPGSNAGMPLTVLRSFAAPPASLSADIDSYRQHVAAAASGLLALLGIDADPVQSREFILLSNILDRAWRENRDLDVAALIREIQSPPFSTVGVIDLDTFYPPKDRIALSLSLNNLLASPAFAGWMEGEALDIQRLLFTESGQPRLSIISIAHLSEAERMFFVTILLNELLSWVRSQPGTPSLRALFYMDEVFGYFPPVANPPSKTPMLTLLKQARAYGLGLVLATQNPVDLDYKGLSNCGTWLLGRLQTERDKQRVLEGLEGAAVQTGVGFDRRYMDRVLSGLGGRVFLMNNVHEDQPVVFHTRWAMSYLRGPMTREQIRQLMASRRSHGHGQAAEAAEQAEAIHVEAEAAVEETKSPSDDVPVDVPQMYLSLPRSVPRDRHVVYRPALLGTGRLHFVRVTYHVDYWEQRWLLYMVHGPIQNSLWEEAELRSEHQLEFQAAAEDGATFAALEPDLTLADNYAAWQKSLKDHLYRTQTLEVWRSPALKKYSEPGESEGTFRIRLRQLLKEERDLKVEKLRQKYAARMETVQGQIERAKETLDREKAEYDQSKYDSLVSVGSSIFGVLLGRKKMSKSNVGKVSTSARTVGKTSRQRADVQRAVDKLDALLVKRSDLEEDLQREIEDLEVAVSATSIDVERLSVRPRKSDITVEKVALVWVPSLKPAVR
jgi:hypothetical protein